MKAESHIKRQSLNAVSMKFDVKPFAIVACLMLRNACHHGIAPISGFTKTRQRARHASATYYAPRVPVAVDGVLMAVPERRRQALPRFLIFEGGDRVQVGLHAPAAVSPTLDEGVVGHQGLLVVEVQVGTRVLLPPPDVHVALGVVLELPRVEVVIDGISCGSPLGCV